MFNLAEKLAESGKLARETVTRVHRLAAESREPEYLVLTRLGLLSEADLARFYAEQLGLDQVSPGDFPTEPVLGDQLSIAFLRKVRALPLVDKPEHLVVALADPGDQDTVEALAFAVRKPLRCCVAAASDIEQAINRLHGPAGMTPIASLNGALRRDDRHLEDAERLRDIGSDAPVIRLVSRWLAQAADAGASDVHIEPLEDRFAVRIRIDGVLAEVDSHPLDFHPAVVSRIKILAQLDIAEKRLAQDGRLTVAVRGQQVDIRVSIVPTVDSESIVLRLLDRSAVPLDFEALGFSGEGFGRYLRTLDRPHGIVLVTGPTGSGKSTTLYASLRHLQKPELKILTAEDPVEQRLSGINQSQVKPQIGLTFPSLLRSFLRHDPDIIMVGEIRDTETARIAIQAALTGHLVLSTLHTNDAASGVTRLLDMGIEDYLITATVNGIAAQRLVRRLCPACKRPVSPDPELLHSLGLRPTRDISFYEAVGCDVCQHTGYRGRDAIYEVLLLDDELKRLILRGAAAGDIHEAARRAGMETLRECGLRKVVAGVTTLSEVLRVAGAAHS